MDFTTCVVTKIGLSKNDKPYLLVDTYVEEFCVTQIAFLKVGASTDKYVVGEEFEIPTLALKTLS